MQLNGQSRSLVTIYGNKGHLAIGGDSHQKLIVYATKDNESFYQLINGTPNNTSNGVEMNIFAGGQPGNYPIRYVVNAEQAIAAAMTFAQDGSLTSQFQWEKT